jgi:hypothetical protein
LLHHDGKDRPAAKKGSPETRVYYEVPDLVGNIDDRAWPVRPSVIEENVYPAKPFHRRTDSLFNILPVRDITLKCKGMNAEIIHYLICHASAPIEVHIGYDNMCAFPCKHASSSLTYTGTGRSGAESYLVFQFHGSTSRDILPK